MYLYGRGRLINKVAFNWRKVKNLAFLSTRSSRLLCHTHVRVLVSYTVCVRELAANSGGHCRRSADFVLRFRRLSRNISGGKKDFLATVHPQKSGGSTTTSSFIPWYEFHLHIRGGRKVSFISCLISREIFVHWVGRSVECDSFFSSSASFKTGEIRNTLWRFLTREKRKSVFNEGNFSVVLLFFVFLRLFCLNYSKRENLESFF